MERSLLSGTFLQFTFLKGLSMSLTTQLGSICLSRNPFTFLCSVHGSPVGASCMQPNSLRSLYIVYSFHLLSIVLCQLRLGRIYSLNRGNDRHLCKPYTRGEIRMLGDANEGRISQREPTKPSPEYVNLWV